MKHVRSMFTLAATVIFALVWSVSAEAVPKRTLDNLQAAYNGESNAHARYVAFAAKADEEGYARVASLFRAAARAEEIHAANHAVVIEKLGGKPSMTLDEVAVKSTRDNLAAAIAGETYERDTMYPSFIKQARSDRSKDAIQTLNYAQQAETEHARLYTEALDLLDVTRGDGAQVYYVCQVCGYTTTKLDFDKCPACFNPKEKYVRVG